MNVIIQSNLKTLQKTRALLSILTNEELSNTTVAPYYSSIGSHIRHVLDFYECVLNIDCDKRIDLTARKRNNDVETNCEIALQYLNVIIDRLNGFDCDIEEKVIVIDDLGLGKTEIQYTLGAIFAQANSHAIHHYAIINYILDRLGIVLQDEDFGYNPTTPRPEINLN
ncbi:MAG: DinB family protein [Flavobacteriaceae bacterium]|nr:DinB family protein [Flavobacteriaceae bacterium]